MVSQLNLRTLIACSLIAVCCSTAASGDGLKDNGANDQKNRGEWLSGVDYRKDTQEYFSGITVAFNGDIERSGFALRVMGLRENFDLDPGSGVSWQGDVMLGYLFNRQHLDAGIFVGFDWQDVRLRPDNLSARVRGTETGVKVAGWVETDRELPHFFSLSGEYSTAFDSYWVRGRLGLTRNKVAFGPEVSIEGDEDGRQKRLGGFITFDLKLLRSTEVTLSGGYQWANDSGTVTDRGGGSEPYANVRFITPF
jgi:hypothetical protein